MARDIEEFLRKAAERRQQQKGGGGKQPQQRPPQQQPPRRRPVAQEPVIIDEVQAEIVQPARRPAPPRQRPAQSPPRKKSSIREQSVSDHVKSHIDTSSIGNHADQLGERISSVHDKVDARIHQRLDRDLSRIDDTPSVTDAPRKVIFGKRTDAAAAEIREMLSNPKSVGHAILIAEILKRPDLNL